jgi:hypothetical protein
MAVLTGRSAAQLRSHTKVLGGELQVEALVISRYPRVPEYVAYASDRTKTPRGPLDEPLIPALGFAPT